MDKLTLAKLAISRGTILHGPFENIDHLKFFVIMGEKDGVFVGFFFINSDIAPSIRQKHEQFAMQMPIKKEDYNFLKYGSFIGANHLKVLDKETLTQDIAEGIVKIKGSLTESDLTMLLEAVRGSKLFSKIEKDTFFR